MGWGGGVVLRKRPPGREWGVKHVDEQEREVEMREERRFIIPDVYTTFHHILFYYVVSL